MHIHSDAKPTAGARFGRIFGGALCLLLPGCSGLELPLGLGMTAATLETASLVNTDKSTVDHLASFDRNLDCDIVAWERGARDNWCEPKPISGPTRPEMPFCYRSLGEITCYERPLPPQTGVTVGRRVDPYDPRFVE